MLEKIAGTLKNYKEDDSLNITEDTSFKELELDSLDTIELIMQLEEELGVTIDIDEDVQTVGELIKVIEAAQ